MRAETPPQPPPDDQSVDTSRETRQIQKVALYALFLNLALAGLKVVLAVVSDSLAISASAIDSATDVVASLVMFTGLRLSTRRTPSFPLGLYKIENLLSVAVALAIFFAGYEIVREIFLTPARRTTISLPTIAWLAGGTLATWFFGLYAVRMGRRTGSPTLVAEGRHRQTDVLSSLVVLLSVVLSYFRVGSLWGISIDQIAAGLVLVFIALAGWELLTDGMRVLLDASIDFPTLNRIQKIILAEPRVIAVKSLIGRSAGRFRFIQATVSVRTDDLEEAQRLSAEIGLRIREAIPHVERVLIQCEPRPRTHYRLAVPLADSAGIVSPHFGEAPYFALLRIRRADHGIEEREVLANPHTGVAKAKGIRVAEWLADHKVDHLFVREDLAQRGPAYVLASAGIEVHVTAAKDLDAALAEARTLVG